MVSLIDIESFIVYNMYFIVQYDKFNKYREFNSIEHVFPRSNLEAMPNPTMTRGKKNYTT